MNSNPLDGVEQFGPDVSIMDDSAIIVTYWSNVSGTSKMEQFVSVRAPGGAWSHGKRRQTNDMATDLALLPIKCGDTYPGVEDDFRFWGDYHRGTSGRTHVHSLRVETIAGDTPSVQLESSALSWSSWR